MLSSCPGKFETFRIALDDPRLTGTIDPASKTLQVGFQTFASGWKDGELLIDNFKCGAQAQ